MQREVLVVGYDGAVSTDIAGPVDVFDGAGKVCGGHRPRWGDGFGVSGGLRMEAEDLRDVAAGVDTVLVAGGTAFEAAAADPEPRPRLRRVADGARVATHWAFCDRLAAENPSVEVVPDAIHVRDARVVTSAGVTAGNDLALALAAQPDVTAHFVAATPDPVRCDSGLTIVPTTTFDALDRADLVAAWPAEVHPTATWTASVCSGSTLLAQAGILDGRPATTHWVLRDEPAKLGAVVSTERVVVDGFVVTAAGVSAGIDVALALAGRIWGDERAEFTQLVIEYDPRPPYDSGSPDTASPGLVALARGVRPGGGVRRRVTSLDVARGADPDPRHPVRGDPPGLYGGCRSPAARPGDRTSPEGSSDSWGAQR